MALLRRLEPHLLWGITGGGLLALTWRHWPDPWIDFGRELYVPWRLAHGDLLYRDIAWFNGPLSAWLNAALFRVLGEGLMVLVAANAVWLALWCALWQRLLARLSSDGVASLAVAVGLALCGVAQLVWVGNYNWLSPYAHELTHGLLLGLAAIAAFDRWLRGRAGTWLALSGLLLGLAALTKSEVWLASTGAIGLALLLDLAPPGAPGRARGRALALFAAAAALPGLAAWLYLQTDLSAGDAAAALLQPVAQAATVGLADQVFYRRVAGLDAPGANLLRIGQALLWLVVPVGAFALLGIWRRGRALDDALRRAGVRRVLVATAIVAALLGWFFVPPGVLKWVRALPVLLAGLALQRIVGAWRVRSADPIGHADAILAAALIVFAGLLLAKMALAVRLAHYGFALTWPGLSLAVVAAAAWLPEAFERRGVPALGLRCAVVAGVALCVGVGVSLTAGQVGLETQRVGTGRDAFYARPGRGGLLEAVRRYLAGRRDAGSSLIVVPEGVMLNYLARMPNPTPYLNFMPPELALFGEAAMVSAVRSEPPRYLLEVHKSTAEYGVALFGRDYAEALAAALREDTRPLASWGDPPLEPGSRVGARLSLRVDGADPSSD